MAEHGELPACDRPQLAADTRLAMKRLRAFGHAFPASRPHIQRIEGWYAWQRGRHSQARQHWNKAIAEADRFNKVFEKGLAHYDMGRFEANGADHLQRAREIFERLDARYYARTTDALIS
jgi:tetratricopeptide (TPR) repeat protein